MVREFKLPDVGEGVAEGELVSWLVEPGDAVGEDQPVAEVETDKALVEVPAPVDGTVRDLHYEEGDVIPVGEVFITSDVGGREAEDETEIEPGTSMKRNQPRPPTGPETAGDPGAIGSETGEVETPDDRVFAPRACDGWPARRGSTSRTSRAAARRSDHHGGRPDCSSGGAVDAGGAARNCGRGRGSRLRIDRGGCDRGRNRRYNGRNGHRDREPRPELLRTANAASPDAAGRVG